MKPIYKPSNLLILTACAAMLLAPLFGFPAMYLYDAGNYKDAAEAFMFTAIFIGYPFICWIVMADQATKKAKPQARYPYLN